MSYPIIIADAIDSVSYSIGELFENPYGFRATNPVPLRGELFENLPKSHRFAVSYSIGEVFENACVL